MTLNQISNPLSLCEFAVRCDFLGQSQPLPKYFDNEITTDPSWHFWSLSHTCHISKMRHDMVERSISLEKNDMIEKSKISWRRGAFIMSLKIEDMQMHILCLSWLANSGSTELCEIIRLNFINLCSSYILSLNRQS